MIDFAAFAEMISNAAAASLQRSALVVARRAKAKAPVRNILAEAKRMTRVKTVAEFESDRRALGPDVPIQPLRVIRTNRAYRLIKIRRLSESGVLADEDVFEDLHRQGRYELSSGRADYNGQLGGRLRGEIYASEVEVDGNHLEVSVISPTPYARYQEFGTVHNVAHPFMRPALEESRAEIIADLKASVLAAAKASKPSGRGGTVVIRLKAEVG